MRQRIATLSPFSTPNERKPFASAVTRSVASAQLTGDQAPSFSTMNAGVVQPASTARCQSSPIVVTADAVGDWGNVA